MFDEGRLSSEERPYARIMGGALDVGVDEKTRSGYDQKDRRKVMSLLDIPTGLARTQDRKDT